ncbi:MAG: SAM-dependent methyltransferase [Clostridia bacterium]|nr:SAM-dependent methyltransferase [Clostridia bacterium]
MKEIPKLTPRLAAAASFCRQGAFVADIGTDHAYLPIALCLSGRARGAIASDINAGPVERAEENIKNYGLDGKIEVRRADGLDGIEQFAPDDIMILGMGGELIARIISDAPWTKNKSINLCLQPMTHPEYLREFLLENGYEIIDEAIAEEEKIYQIILARFSGEKQSLAPEELLLGRINVARGGDALVRLGEHWISVIERRADGKRTSGADVSEDTELIQRIKIAIGR